MSEPSLYVALSGQIALERRMATIAHNIANAGTTGFRAEEVHFESILSGMTTDPTAFASTGDSYLSTLGGGRVHTGNLLDVAIQGDGFLAIATPAGTAYTRDGRFQLLETGELQSLSGYPILDAGEAPILLDPSAGEVHIARDGMITQNGRQVAAIGLFALDLSQGYQRSDNAAILPALPATPIVTFTSDGIVQGYVEESNVNAVGEMTRLIAVSRAFESLQAAIDEAQNAQKNAIQTLA